MSAIALNLESAEERRPDPSYQIVPHQTNLIENALKFVQPGFPPSVRVESRLYNGKMRVCVSDNGIGIKPEHRDRIFKIFGRVHSDKEYPGTGIGLVIVQKSCKTSDGQRLDRTGKVLQVVLAGIEAFQFGN